jgi:RNA polymerase sigma-70 factor (ECF subfamily)
MKTNQFDPPEVTQSMDDAALVRRILQGESELFAILRLRWHGRVCRVLGSILRNEQDREDAAQQTYLLAYMHLRDFTGRAAFSTWLTRIACNEAFAILRKRGRHLSLSDVRDLESDGPATVEATPEEQATAGQSQRVLSRAVGRLTPNYRIAFMLREVEELSTAETAVRLGITVQAVKTRIHRARLALRRSLSKTEGQAALL